MRNGSAEGRAKVAAAIVACAVLIAIGLITRRLPEQAKAKALNPLERAFQVPEGQLKRLLSKEDLENTAALVQVPINTRNVWATLVSDDGAHVYCPPCSDSLFRIPRAYDRIPKNPRLQLQFKSDSPPGVHNVPVALPPGRMMMKGVPLPDRNFACELYAPSIGWPGLQFRYRGPHRGQIGRITILNSTWYRPGKDESFPGASDPKGSVGVEFPWPQSARAVRAEIVEVEMQASSTQLKVKAELCEMNGAAYFRVNREQILSLPDGDSITVPVQGIHVRASRPNRRPHFLCSIRPLRRGREDFDWERRTVLEIVGPEPSTLGLQQIEIDGSTFKARALAEGPIKTGPVEIVLRKTHSELKVIRHSVVDLPVEIPHH